MFRSRFVVGLALLSGLALCGMANGAFYFDIWPTTADGSMDMHPTEGYAIGGEGNMRFTKVYHHMTFMGFEGKSDGKDGIPDARQKAGKNDSNDGVLMVDWLVGKKAFWAVVYVRDADAQTCDPTSVPGTYINDPVTIVGFRVANAGAFVDRGLDANGVVKAGGYGGCCGTYDAPLLDGGENAPPAWRIGRPPYTAIGDIGTSGTGAVAEYYKVSSVDTKWAGKEVKIGAMAAGGFGTTGFGGFSTNSGLAGSGHFAFDWLVEKSDAMLINSGTITEASCSGSYGELEPRDFNGDGTFGEGWFAKHVDRNIINAIGGGDPECKGLVFQSVNANLWLNPSVFGRDQGGGLFGAYLAVTATLAGDCTNEGDVDVVDILTMLPTFGLVKGDAGFDPECDLNCDDSVDVVDLLTMVEQFGLTLN